MTSEVLCLFKSSRRTEYTQENLRILSGARGSEIKISYKARWLADEVIDRLPEAGDPVLIALADPPYTKSHPIRRAEMVDSSFDGDTLRLTLRLGLRVATESKDRWRTVVEAGQHPKTGSFAVRLDVSDGLLDEIEDAERDLKVWKKQIDAVRHGDGYAKVAFLRVGRVAEIGAQSVEPPYRLISGRTYQVDVLAFNPHLDAETLQDLRLVPFPQPSLVEVEMDAQAMPADGELQLMLVPRAVGEATLESSVSRGAEFWDALWFDWLTLPPEQRTELAVSAVESAEPEVVEAVTAVRRTASSPPHDELATHLLAGYMLLRGQHPIDAELRLRVLDELLEASTGLERLQEQRGIVLHELRQWPEAAQVLGGLTPGVLTAEGRTMLVSSWFMQKIAPEPLDRIRIADFSRDEWFETLLDASSRLTVEQQVHVAQLLATSVLAEDRASRWIRPLATAESLPHRDRFDLLEIWVDADPAAAAAALEDMVIEGTVELVDPALAKFALGVGLDAKRMGLARRAAYALQSHGVDRKDVPGLEELLKTVMERFVREDRSSVGEDIVVSIADVADEKAEIDAALHAAAELIEDLRQRADLDSAARLAKYVSANDHRASKRVRHELKAVLDQLDEAMAKTKTMRQFEQARRRELGEDIKDFVGDKRVLVVGATDQPWWPDLRQEFGFDPGSEWIATEKRKSMSTDKLARKLGKVDLLIIQKARISHKVSEPLEAEAKARGIKVVWPSRPTRDAFTQAIRIALIDQAPSGRAILPGMGLDGLID